MTENLWMNRRPPEVSTTSSIIWQASPATFAELSGHRARLRSLVLGTPSPRMSDGDGLHRLLLAFEELGSNGLRHGRPPVQVTVTATRPRWVLDVTDAAVDRPPSPAVGRDAAEGGLGLYLIARIASGHGWDVRDGRKHVWACIDFAMTA
jgi:two-component sensor histidine kinase